MGIYAGENYTIQRTAAKPRAFTPRARALMFNAEPTPESPELLTLAAFLAALRRIEEWLLTIEARLAHAAAAGESAETAISQIQYDVLAIIAQLRALEGKTDKNDRAAVKRMEELAARAATLQSATTWPASVFR